MVDQPMKLYQISTAMQKFNADERLRLREEWRDVFDALFPTQQT